MKTKEDYYKENYPESQKVDEHGDAIRIVEEFCEWLRWAKGMDIDTPDIYKWLGIDYRAYSREVDRMLNDSKV